MKLLLLCNAHIVLRPPLIREDDATHRIEKGLQAGQLQTAGMAKKKLGNKVFTVELTTRHLHKCRGFLFWFLPLSLSRSYELLTLHRYTFSALYRSTGFPLSANLLVFFFLSREQFCTLSCMQVRSCQWVSFVQRTNWWVLP